MTKDQIISSFKADFAELLAKYDAEMEVKEYYDGYSYTVDGIVFTIHLGNFEYEDLNVGTYVNKDSV